MKLEAWLFNQLWNEGVRQIFGIPGDFVLTTVAWPLTKLADLWGGPGCDAATPRQLREVLEAAAGESP